MRQADDPRGANRRRAGAATATILAAGRGDSKEGAAVIDAWGRHGKLRLKRRCSGDTRGAPPPGTGRAPCGAPVGSVRACETRPGPAGASGGAEWRGTSPPSKPEGSHCVRRSFALPDPGPRLGPGGWALARPPARPGIVLLHTGDGGRRTKTPVDRARIGAVRTYWAARSSEVQSKPEADADSHLAGSLGGRGTSAPCTRTGAGTPAPDTSRPAPSRVASPGVAGLESGP